MPTISDPGSRLVAAAWAAGHTVVPVPGPSAALAALAVAGLPSDRFLFLGFLPRKAGERRRALAEVTALPYTLVLFEAPHRLSALLEDALAVLGDRPVVVARELTKVHEEVFRGTLSAARAHFTAPRGEFTLVIAGASTPAPASAPAEMAARIATLRAAGARDAEIAAQIAREFGLSRRAVYRQLTGQKSNSEA